MHFHCAELSWSGWDNTFHKERTTSQIYGAESLMHLHILKQEQWQHYKVEKEVILSKDIEHIFIRKVWHHSDISCTSTSCSEKKHSLNLSLHYSWIREARGVRNHKMPLVPRGVIPHVFFQEGLHKLQLVVPQFVFLRIQEDKIWQHFCLCHYAALLVAAPQRARRTLTTEHIKQAAKLISRRFILAAWLAVGRTLISGAKNLLRAPTPTWMTHCLCCQAW